MICVTKGKAVYGLKIAMLLLLLTAQNTISNEGGKVGCMDLTQFWSH